MTKYDGPISVLIPTTEGPATVTRLVEENGALGESVVVVEGTSAFAGISEAYNQFVGGDPDLISRMFGAHVWRLEISRDIEAGRSWEAGVFLAHLLRSTSRLSFNDKDAPTSVVWITGSVDQQNLAIGSVEHVDHKLSISMDILASHVARGARVLVGLPVADDAAMSGDVRQRAETAGIEILPFATCHELAGRFDLTVPESLDAEEPSPRKRTNIALAALVTACAVLGGTGLLMRRSLPIALDPPLLHSIQHCPTCPEMIALPPWPQPPASAMAQSPRPRRFAMGKYTVTISQYEDFIAEAKHDVGENCRFPATEGAYGWKSERGNFRTPSYPVTPQHPVTCVSWSDAVAYAAWLSRKTGRTYRLPTAAEHEFATRAGASPMGDTKTLEEDLCAVARFAHAGTTIGKQRSVELSCSDRSHGPLPVGSMKANAWKLHDMQGNVWQWMSDCLPESKRKAQASTDVETPGNCKIIRGGGYNSLPDQLFPAYFTLDRNTESARSDAKGFRVVLELP